MTLQVDYNIYIAFCGNQLKLSCDVNNVLLMLYYVDKPKVIWSQSIALRVL